MKQFARIALLAYPKAFRREYGSEWIRSINDLQVHRGLSRPSLYKKVVVDTLATAPKMRWEKMMGATKTALTILAVIVVVGGLVIGSPAVAVVVFGLVGILVLQSSRHDQPISAEVANWGGRWYLWLVGAGALLLIGFGALLTEEDGGLSEVAWATWMLSWLSAAVVGLVGLGLGVTHLVGRRRS